MNLDYLKEFYDLNQNEIQVLDYLDEHICDLDHLNVRSVAKACYTSPSSIVRLAKKLNLSGYSELIYKIKECHLPSPKPDKTVLSEEEIQQFCQYMSASQENLLVILGEGFSSHISAYISEVLNFHYIPNIATSHTRLISSRNNQNIVLIIVSHSGEEASLKETVELLRKGNNKIISFTGNRHSTIAKNSDLCFSSESYSPFSTNVARPQIFFGHTLITFETLICAFINSQSLNKN